MVRAFSRQESVQKSSSFKLKKMFESNSSGRHVQSFTMESGREGQEDCSGRQARSQGSRIGGDRPVHHMNIGSALKDATFKGPISCLDNIKGRTASHLDMENMKERFSKLLLGEDMSGGGKGVSSALALSNAITNLAASAFGEQRKLEPMPAERKTRWRKEMDWLLSVTDHIVEFVPSQQKSKDGINMEIMVTRQRNDLHMNIPALRKLDAMLLGYLDNFGSQNEFWYVSKDADDSEKGNFQRNDDKWWLPTVKVSPDGLSNVCRKWLLFQKESVNQVLKAAMAINAQVLSEMEIPENYIEALPKNGRYCLGDSNYKSITDDYFDPEQFLSTSDLSTEHKVLDLKNRIEASVIIWKRKMHHKDHGKSSWSSGVSLEKREIFEERAETILLILKQRFPGISQSTLDISKIQYNKDVGYAILESYSRVIESLASTVMSRIEDVLYADSVAQNPSSANSNGRLSMSSSPISLTQMSQTSEDEAEKLSSSDTPTSMTLSDFMGWSLSQGEADGGKKNDSKGNKDTLLKQANDHKLVNKPANINTKKLSYLEKLENFSLRSPTARH
ncbi:rop guanine nucleotide exchange factor 12 [Cannabis sativa]|uniref:PRONE domain-containing protein n=1 Tax=Cannabis sativa TaxID=3483 RepID=A0A803P2S6_CANSA|nr:rop guanine nucleotide exchange factor 12 [Cannabis sativa]